MKIKIEKDKASIVELEDIVAGAISEYIIETEFSSDWNGLTIKAIFNNGNISYETAIIDNNVIIPQLSNGKWYVGFVGYTIADEVKTKQISTNLIAYQVIKGAGELETETQEVPESTVWEQYIATINSILSSTESARDITEQYRDTTLGYKNDTETLKGQVEALKEETESIKNTAQEFVSAVTFLTFEVDLSDGNMYLNSSESLSNMGFEINENGESEVNING